MKQALTGQGTAGMATRRAALEILIRVERDRAFADVLLGNRLSVFDNAADRRLVTELVLGTIAWQGRLDYELARLSSRPLAEVDPTVHTILRIGLYQLRRLTRLPPHAAVDTAVRLAGEMPHADRIKGFVNAILRAALRSDIPLPDRQRDEVEFLAIAHSHPRWLVAKFVEWFKRHDAETIMAAHNQPAPNVVRLNLSCGKPDSLIARLERDGMAIERQGLLPETVILKGAPAFASASFREGLFVPQSEASQMVTHLLAPSPAATVIDCAAAPGGKSTHLAEMVGADGRVIALDHNFAGLRRVKTMASRLQHRNVFAVRCDASRALPLAPASAPFVLLDAPCSGLGTLREHPEIRWRLVPDDFARMAQLQSRMLRKASKLVKPGGVIVYAVCSLAPEEGEGVVTSFLSDRREFVMDWPTTAPLADAVGDDGFMRTRPDRGSRDGFFAARLKRR